MVSVFMTISSGFLKICRAGKDLIPTATVGIRNPGKWYTVWEYDMTRTKRYEHLHDWISEIFHDKKRSTAPTASATPTAGMISSFFIGISHPPRDDVMNLGIVRPK